VKIARTYKTNTRNIFTMMQNIIHCIRRAKRLIYLEDQYLTSYHVADELKQQLSNKQDLIVIIVTGRMSDLPGAVTRRNRFLAVLNYNAYSNRVGVYHPINKHDGGHKIYVHSKMMIVDDIWAYVGTANLNHRSFAGDTEIGALVIDGEVKFGRRKFALELRKALWEEHLGRKFKYEELLDYSNAKLLWDKAIRDSNSHVALLLQNPEGEPKDYADLIVDPWDAGPIPDPDNPESPFLERR